MCEYSLLITLLLVTQALCECEVEVKAGDTITQIALDVGCGVYMSTTYNVRHCVGWVMGSCLESDSRTLAVRGRVSFFFFIADHVEFEQTSWTNHQ